VPGGGVALLNTVGSLESVEKELEGDMLTGVKILRRSLEEPMRQLAENAGYDGAVVVQNVRQRQKADNNQRIGFDVMSEDYGDMVQKQIIDPAKVTRGGLENAASIAGMILTTEALITDIPEKEKAAPAAPSPDMY
jgi:chaperonin GroEL